MKSIIIQIKPLDIIISPHSSTPTQLVNTEHWEGKWLICYY